MSCRNNNSRFSMPDIAGIKLKELTIPSSYDGARQPLIIGVPESYKEPDDARPLLVGLHSWSAQYTQLTAEFGELCAQYGWLLVLPNFRGPNLTSNPQPQQAGGSLAAQHDIVDAVAYMKQEFSVDETRIYLLGGSGGGHMALLMAGKYPELWGGVCAYCPITSLQEWHAQQNEYAPHIEAVCGGPPGVHPAVNFEYERRSPRTFITNAAATNVRLCHGDKDRCIWPVQSWRTFEKLRDIPHRMEFFSWSGGHEMHSAEGCAWLAQQQKRATPPSRLDIVSDEGKFYFWIYLEPARPYSLARCYAERLIMHDSSEGQIILIEAENCALIKLNLNMLQLRRLCGAQCNEKNMAPAHLSCKEGILTLPSCVERTRWQLIFE